MDDAAACAAIYAPYVTDTAISFETEPPTRGADGGADRGRAATHAWFVLEDDGRVVGYAYGGTFHPRAAYRWACEVSVYLEPAAAAPAPAARSTTACFPHLAERGYRIGHRRHDAPQRRAASACTGRSASSPSAPTGEIGYKFGAWHDVAWTQRPWPPAATRRPSPA